MFRIILFVIVFCVVSPIFSQNIAEANRVVDTLTSSFFSGRGVANKGEKKASKFIVKEYSRLGLASFENGFLQKFNYSVNTFVGNLSVQLNDKNLEVGKDFIVGANSGGGYGSFELVWYNKTNLPSKKQLKKLTERNFFQNKFIVIDDEGVGNDDERFQLLKVNVFGASGIIFLEDKLTHSLSQTYQDYVILKVKKGLITRATKIITIEVNQQFVRDYQSQNVIGYIEGVEHPDSFIVVSAHYDHLGMMGEDVYFPGANDNASGVAMLLNLAEYYVKRGAPKKTIVFIAFGAEEAGILGSKYFTEHPTFAIDQINFVVNLDIMGTGDEGIMVVNGAVYQNRFKLLTQLNSDNKYLSEVKKRGKAANSDHYWFTEKGVPAFFIYTLGGIKAYHDVYDVSATLPLTEFENCFRLLRDFINEL